MGAVSRTVDARRAEGLTLPALKSAYRPSWVDGLRRQTGYARPRRSALERVHGTQASSGNPYGYGRPKPAQAHARDRGGNRVGAQCRPLSRRVPEAPIAPNARRLTRVVLASAASVGVIQTVAAAAGVPRRRRDYADGAWGPGLAAVAVTAAVVGDGDRTRRWALAAGTTLWAARLESLMLPRLRDSDEEDPRYQDFLEGDGVPAVVTKVFLTQALAQLLVSAPIQVAATRPLSTGPRRWLLPAGLAVMAAGVTVEALADRQKSQFMEAKNQARSEGDGEVPDELEVLDSGLWAWSRHPNYFGDSLFWDGVWIASAASSPALWTLPAPVAMTWFLVYATGAKRTEARMEDRPSYRDYQQRVAFFFPRPPQG